MLNGLYLANHDMTDVSSGVTKKIRAQLSAFENLGCSMTEGIIFSDSAVDKAIRRMPLLPSFYDCESSRLVRNLVNNGGLDFVYMRHGVCCAHTIGLLRYLSKHGVLSVIEFPTFPYDRNSAGLKWELQLAKDRCSRRKMASYVSFGTNYSDRDEIFQIPCIKLSNGVDAKSCVPRKTLPNPVEGIAFIGVALVTYWNGYDRLIRAMREYRDSHRMGPKLLFNIVGDGDELPSLRKLVSELEMEQEVVFHGFLSGEALERVYEESDIGVGSLAPSRKYKEHVMSSLKTKEYAAKGIPFIKGDRDQIFDSAGVDFVFDVTDDDQAIDLPGIIDWYKGLVGREPGCKLAERIHGFSEQRLTWEAQLKPVVDRIAMCIDAGREMSIE